jgi:hypothetical protein
LNNNPLIENDEQDKLLKLVTSQNLIGNQIGTSAYNTRTSALKDQNNLDVGRRAGGYSAN